MKPIFIQAAIVRLIIHAVVHPGHPVTKSDAELIYNIGLHFPITWSSALYAGRLLIAKDDELFPVAEDEDDPPASEEIEFVPELDEFTGSFDRKNWNYTGA